MDDNKRTGIEELRRRQAAREAGQGGSGDGNEIRQQVRPSRPSVSRPQWSEDAQPVFRTWKLVSGILSIVFTMLVLFQSCAAGASNTIAHNGESGGFAGLIVSIMLLAGGIVAIATRNSRGTGGDTAITALFGIGAIIGFLLAGSFKDLLIWSAWCLANAVIAVVSITKKRGAKYAAKSVGKMVAIALVCFIILLVMGWMWIASLMKKSVNTDRPAVTSSQSESSPTKGQSVAGIGEPLTLDGVQATMVEVYESPGEGYTKPDEGKVFIVCEFEVENGSDKDLNISAMASYDAYVDDYDVGVEWTAPGDIEVLGGSIAPGKKTRGAVVCQADPDWSTVEIHLKPGMFIGGDMVFAAVK